LLFPQSIWVGVWTGVSEEKRMIGESFQLDDDFDVVRLDWQPIERHPRPFRKKNPNDFGRMAGKFCPSLSHMLL
jgi:hypothetical protein